MGRVFVIALAIVIVIGLTLLKWTRRHGAPRAGDFFKVAIPRTLDRPLAMGTRMDVAAVLKKAGVPTAEIRGLIDGAHDEELLARYWAIRDQAGGGA